MRGNITMTVRVQPSVIGIRYGIAIGIEIEIELYAMSPGLPIDLGE